jgi:hypothetical protein
MNWGCWARRLVGAAAVFGLVVIVVASRRPDAGLVAAEIEIAQPPARVYAWLVEPERLGRWVDGLERLEPIGTTGLRVGSRWRLGGAGGILELTGFEPGERAEYRIEGRSRLRARFTRRLGLDLGPRDRGSFVRAECLTRWRSPLVQALEPVWTRLERRRLPAQLRRLAALAEAGPDAAR